MHTCPDCGQACYCGADCDDHDTGDECVEDCIHYLRCENTMEDDGGWEPEGWEEREQNDKEFRSTPEMLAPKSSDGG